jgi:putative ABC transport system permease protein
MVRDILYAFQALRRAPLFSLAIALSLAIGIAANTALFSVTHAVLIRDLPYAEPDRLVTFRVHSPVYEPPGSNGIMLSPKLGRIVPERLTALEAFGTYSGAFVNLTRAGSATSASAARISPGLLEALRLQPAKGRRFLPEEHVSGRDRAIILTHELWKRWFAGEENLVGTSVMVDGAPHLVAGILPPGPTLPDRSAELLLPAVPVSAANQTNYYLESVGRLRAGASLEEAKAGLSSLQAVFQEDTLSGVSVWPLLSKLREKDRGTLVFLSGAVALVLLIVCANAANLALARAIQRTSDMAVRAALGASRWRLARIVVAESVVLATAGAAMGLLLATWLTELVLTVAPTSLRLQDRVEVELNVPVVLFALVATFVACVLFGLFAAWRTSRADIIAHVKEAGVRHSAGKGQRALRSGIVAAEIALALALTVGAGLMLRSYLKMEGTDLGFEPRNLRVLELHFPGEKYRGRELVTQIPDQLLERVRAHTGVEVAAVTSQSPAIMSMTADVNIPGRPDDGLQAGIVQGSEGFVEGLGLRLLRGRMLRLEDFNSGGTVVLVDQTFAERCFPSEEALGKTFSAAGMKGLTIVGVVAPYEDRGLGTKHEPTVFFPGRAGVIQLNTRGTMPLYMLIRTAVPVDRLTADVAAIVRELDPDIAVSRADEVDELMRHTLELPRFRLLLLLAFAGCALLLAGLGTFSVVAYNASQRRHELGIRVAVGATPGSLSWLVVKSGLAVALVGVACGLVASVAVSRTLTTMLFEVSALDPLTFSSVAALLVVLVVVASHLAARRATRLDVRAVVSGEGS